jgi:hypothetical protein
VKEWATPQAHDVHIGDVSRVGRFGKTAGGRNLTDEVELWSTPTARDQKNTSTAIVGATDETKVGPGMDDRSQRPSDVMADAGNGLVSQPRRGSQGRDGLGSASAAHVGHTDSGRRQLDFNGATVTPSDRENDGVPESAIIDVPDASTTGLPRCQCDAIQRERRRFEGRATSELYRPFFPPGPADRDAWAEILSSSPNLAPALSRFDVFCQHAIDAGYLDVSMVGRSSKEIGTAIRKTVAAQKAQQQIRGLTHVVARRMVGRVDALRSGGNGVVALQGAFAFISLRRRAGV